MIKKEYRPICVAILIGALGIGAYLYLQTEDLPVSGADPVVNTPVANNDTPNSANNTPADVQDTSETQDRTVTPESAEVVAPLVDPIVEAQQKLVKEFKNKIQLELDLPQDMNFAELDLEGDVAAMEGMSPAGDRKMLIIAAPRTASPETIAAYLDEQKISIPSLVDHKFKISGEVKTVPGPKGSGISQIKVIPGGQSNGTAVYAAHLERADKKGSYVFVMRASPHYFENYDGDWDGMLATLSTK